MEPAPELCVLLGRYYAASARGDAALLDELIARDPGALVVGTDPGEWWQGGQVIIDTWAAAWRQRGGLPVQNSRPQAYRDGAVGWLADQAQWVLPNGGAVPFRLTAVFVQRDGVWKLVQAHFSLGVANSQVSAHAEPAAEH